MNNFASALYDMLPIVLGIAFLFIIRSINLVKTKITIDTPDVLDFINSTKTSNDGPIEGSNTILDLLIVSGQLSRCENIDKYAISRGVATYRTISGVCAMKKSRQSGIILVANDPRPMSRIIAAHDAVSGVLLAYAIDNNFKMVGKWT